MIDDIISYLYTELAGNDLHLITGVRSFNFRYSGQVSIGFFLQNCDEC